MEGMHFSEIKKIYILYEKQFNFVFKQSFAFDFLSYLKIRVAVVFYDYFAE